MLARVSAPGPVHVYLARHGQTAYNHEGRFQGQMEVPLDDTGREQAAELAERAAAHSFAALWCSPLLRARETADIVAARIGLEPVEDARLMETDAGDWTDRSFAEINAHSPEAFAAFVAGHPAFAFPGGESFNEMSARSMTAVLGLVADHPGETIVAVSHADPIKAIVAAAASSLGNIDNLVVLNGAEGMEDMLAKAMTMGGAGLGLAQKLMTSIKTDKPSHDSTYAGVPVGAVEGGPHIPCPPTARSTQRRHDFQHPMPLSFLTKAACHTSVSFRQPNPAKPECVERRHAAMSAIRDRFCMVSGAQELGIAVSRFFSGAGSAETAHGALQRRGTGNDTGPV